ncbi:hypothetical protein M0804_015363 [Polistes exclamans]|nr:hypothetical protein M0804_015363 [Polistes exclamans]
MLDQHIRIYLITDAYVEFLQKQAKSLDLPVKVYHVHLGKHIVVLAWLGTEPTEPAILLNSHMDVVSVFEDKWIYLSFSAHMDEHGNIYSRGSQDMKCVGIQYLEAVRRMKMSTQRFKGTVHISFVPNEEIDGKLVMKEALEKEKLKDPGKYQLGLVTTINLTQLKGGIQTNVIPNELIAAFDIRLALSIDHDEFEANIRSRNGAKKVYFTRLNKKIQKLRTPNWMIPIHFGLHLKRHAKA